MKKWDSTDTIEEADHTIIFSEREENKSIVPYFICFMIKEITKYICCREITPTPPPLGSMRGGGG